MLNVGGEGDWETTTQKLWCKFQPNLKQKIDYPIISLIRPLTYKAMALYPDIKAMALYMNEIFILKKCYDSKKKLLNKSNTEEYIHDFKPIFDTF